MSDAPFLMASTMTLLTNRTMGASSMSEFAASPPAASSSPPVTSRFSRSKPSSSPRFDIDVSTASMARATRISSLSCSTTMASMRSVVWNLISSRACRFVGSQTARNKRLPRCKIGRIRCFSSSFSSTSLTTSKSRSTASRSSSGTPNSCAAAIAICRGSPMRLATRCGTRLPLLPSIAVSAAIRSASLKRHRPAPVGAEGQSKDLGLR